jgi:gliding motility-associated-like protein
MNELKDILNHYTQEPPAGSWERLSQRLDLVLPTEGSSAASQASATGAAKGGAFSLSKALLTAGATLLTAAAVTTAVVVGLRHNAPETPAPESTPVVMADSITVEETTPLETTTPADNPVPAAFSCDFGEDKALPVENAASEKANPIPTSPDIAQTPTATPSPVVSPAPISPASKNSPVQPVIAHVAIPQSSVIMRQQQEDPVIQNRDSEEIEWQQPSKIEIPNVFTPNGDGYNDLFVILGIENCVKRELNVYDRNGRAVYRNRSYENTWNGDNCPDGTYTYQFRYSQNGIEQELRGTVTIIRK